MPSRDMDLEKVVIGIERCVSAEDESNSVGKHGAQQRLHHDIDEEEKNRFATAVTSFTPSTHDQSSDNADQAIPRRSALDPASPDFRTQDWMQSVARLKASDDRILPRTGSVAFRNLSVIGSTTIDYQKDVGNLWLDAIWLLRRVCGRSQERRPTILRDFEGIVKPGEMIIVLGPPGSGCTTFLKALTGETHGFEVERSSYVNYQGVSRAIMNRTFRGEITYTAELDVHFPMLTVEETLTLAARTRVPRVVPPGYTQASWAVHLRDAYIAMFGIGHVRNTPVGNDFIRGVSGGERKRVSIAEAALTGAAIQAWDNSTRGLDSANAIEFCRTIRSKTQVDKSIALVSMYQAPEPAFELFDKVVLLYEGRQIYFGAASHARAYFESLGFCCPPRQTTADFLTSMTSPQERVVRDGCQAPRTADEFAKAWMDSQERRELCKEIDDYDAQYSLQGPACKDFYASRELEKSKYQRAQSPFTRSYLEQVQLCCWRGYRRLRADPTFTLGLLFGNFAMALLLGSVFYNSPVATGSFFIRGGVIFLAVLMNAFGSSIEILVLYAQRPIVEKHARYALYHPSAEALASVLLDLPYKICNAVLFNTTIYFMANLRREPNAYFFFLLTSFLILITMSMLFRTIASISRTVPGAMTPAAVLFLAILIFTGYALPIDYMLGWSRWINYINPVAYGFESLMINEFSGRDYACSDRVPVYGNLQDGTQVCAAQGAVPGQAFVDGTLYIETAFSYYPAHKWRNVGIIIVMMVIFTCTHLIGAELIREKKSKGEVLQFRRGKQASILTKTLDEESAEKCKPGNYAPNGIALATTDDVLQQTAVFSWRNVCYDITVKGKTRQILDHVDGWIKPGTLTALMGVSGAGKTSLLDVLAKRVTTGVITGEMLVDGCPRDSSFQRKTGYVQQQDLHLPTSTVREAISFSALLRQPRNVPRQEKLDYVNKVIELLDMDSFADAVIGLPGYGLNIEQRKRLTIAIELAAKPELLLFLDEPTSGLDSQTSWAICSLLEKLKDLGQAILCTVHQPSAILFERFDRLLLLQNNGRTVYFGEVGKDSSTLIDYFERHSGLRCPERANPAEWMLEVIGAAPNSTTDKDWHQIWRSSAEYRETHQELDRLAAKGPPLQPASVSAPTTESRPGHAGWVIGWSPKLTQRSLTTPPSSAPATPISHGDESHRQFAAGFVTQAQQVTLRVFRHYWRSPGYIAAKFLLSLTTSLFVGFVFFNASTTHQGLQNQMFAIVLIMTIFAQLVYQMIPQFLLQRSLFEARERSSKAYSWYVFMACNILVELPWNSLMAAIMFFCVYYPMGLYHNAELTHAVSERGALFFLVVWQFFMFTSSFAHLAISAVESAENGANIANLAFSLMLVFCGVLATPTSMPGFWIWMYRVSPFTYLVAGFLAAGLGNSRTFCADNEFYNFDPPNGVTCEQYMAPYLQRAGGYLKQANATSACQYCLYSDTNVFLEGLSLSFDDRWEYFGIGMVYVTVNIAGALFLYWLVRVPKSKGKEKTSPPYSVI